MDARAARSRPEPDRNTWRHPPSSVPCLRLQANPALTPNAVRRSSYTAEVRNGEPKRRARSLNALARSEWLHSSGSEKGSPPADRSRTNARMEPAHHLGHNRNRWRIPLRGQRVGPRRQVGADVTRAGRPSMGVKATTTRMDPTRLEHARMDNICGHQLVGRHARRRQHVWSTQTTAHRMEYRAVGQHRGARTRRG